MTSKIQNRLAGIVVLTILGIIILLNLFDGKKRYYQDELAAIPLIITKSNENIGEQDIMNQSQLFVESKLTEGLQETICEQQNLEKQQLKPIKVKSNEQLVQMQKTTNKVKSYVVQLGALKNTNKVNNIVSKLYKAGYKVYTLPDTPVHGRITRILVGPDTSKERLKKLLVELEEISGLSGIVIGYQR